MRNERALDTGNRNNLARRCKPVLLAQLYYAERELLFCCGVFFAFLGFVAEGLFDSFPLEHFADTCLRSRGIRSRGIRLAVTPRAPAVCIFAEGVLYRASQSERTQLRAA